MKVTMRQVLGLLAVWLSGVICVAGQPDKGRVLILDTDRVLEGDIERSGDQYRVRRQSGETWLPAAKVRALCNSLEEAYVYLRDRANLEDPDERLRLARWCRAHGLTDQALHEAKTALELRPTHEETRRLVQILQRPESATAKAEPTPAPAEPEALPPVDFNNEAIGLFLTKVQPILMNTCVNCHGGAKSGAFKLTRTYADTQAHPRATRQNLAAVMALVQREKPHDSPILSWAVTVHGDADKPPIKDRQAPAYKAMEEWVKLAVKGMPAKIEPTSPLPENRLEAEMSPPGSIPFAVGAPHKPEAKPASEPKAPATMAPMNEPKPPASSSTTPPSSLPADPFDPAIFNQQNPKK